jgi:hypothetical protein
MSEPESSSYREVSDELTTFYVDDFRTGQQLQITAAIRSIGGQVTYDRDASHLGEPRARYKVTLPPGTIHEGIDAHMAPQTITLPVGERKLCVFPEEERVLLAWLPGDSADDTLWDGVNRRPEANGE